MEVGQFASFLNTLIGGDKEKKRKERKGPQEDFLL